MKITDDALRAAAEKWLEENGYQIIEDDSFSEAMRLAAWEGFMAGAAYLSALPGPAQEGELKSCPFCGGPAKPHKTLNDRVACQRDTCWIYHRYMTIGDWNTRAAPSHVDDKNVADIPGEEGLVEAMAKEAYEAMRWAIMRAPCHDETPPKWQEGGNSFVQDRARQAMKAALSAARPAIEASLREKLRHAWRQNFNLRRQLGEMREALRKYGEHRAPCLILPGIGSDEYRTQCTCGLEKALRGEGGINGMNIAECRNHLRWNRVSE